MEYECKVTQEIEKCDFSVKVSNYFPFYGFGIFLWHKPWDVICEI